MMRRFALIAVVLLAAQFATAGDTTSLGQPLEGLEPTPIEVIVADPDAWEGKDVRISGEVTGVCAMQGCWMDLVSPENATLRVKVDDGVIVFPPEAVGQRAVAEGKVEIVEMTKDEYTGWMKHVAEEEGKEFDLESLGEAPYRIVRLRGLGAEIGSR
jgi:hypothetical protein